MISVAVPRVGQAVASLLETHRRTFEVEELEHRRSLGSTAVRRTLKARLSKLEKGSAAPKVEVLWVDVDSGQTHEGVLKARYGDQIPPDVEPITVSAECEVQVVREFTSVLGYRPRRKVTEA